MLARHIFPRFLRTKYGEKVHEYVIVCASTGTAAVNIDGTTPHSRFGLGTATKGPTGVSERLPDRAKRHWMTRTFTLIWDEFGMVSSDFFQLFHDVARIMRGHDLYSNIQLIGVGDSLQLMPIQSMERRQDVSMDEAGPHDFSRGKVRHAFESNAYRYFNFHHVLMTGSNRHADADFLRFLDNISVGCMDEEVCSMMEYLQSSRFTSQ